MLLENKIPSMAPSYLDILNLRATKKSNKTNVHVHFPLSVTVSFPSLITCADHQTALWTGHFLPCDAGEKSHKDLGSL